MVNKTLQQIHKKLLSNQKTISTAESCTAGLLSHLLTSISGSSGYFLLGVTSYSNQSKEKILKIPARTIIKYGAVSSQVAILMAENIRKIMHADFGLSITGIAGPFGATKNKPVGTVFIGLSAKNKNSCHKFLFSGSRQIIRKKSAQEALRLLLKSL
ncbi:MAG: CinA family protein [Candidatus Omnitrophota bacterium]